MIPSRVVSKWPFGSNPAGLESSTWNEASGIKRDRWEFQFVGMCPAIRKKASAYPIPNGEKGKIRTERPNAPKARRPKTNNTNDKHDRRNKSAAHRDSPCAITNRHHN